MSYRRDAPSTEQIPLPIETVYCSEIDAVMRARNTLSGTKFNRFGIDNFNRVYFNYPPEWQTSNVGEKIIGVNNMTMHWKDGNLRFTLYVRKYKRIIPESDDDDINQKAINETDNDTFEDQIQVFHIPIDIRISCNDTWDDIKNKIMSVINQHTLYNYLHHAIVKIYNVLLRHASRVS